MLGVRGGEGDAENRRNVQYIKKVNKSRDFLSSRQNFAFLERNSKAPSLHLFP